MKFEFSQEFLEKYSNINFHENPSSGSRIVLCGRTDGQTDRREVNSLFFGILRKRLEKNFSQLLPSSCILLSFRSKSSSDFKQPDVKLPNLCFSLASGATFTAFIILIIAS